MTFLVIDHNYQVFPAFNVIYNVYGPFLTTKTSISDKKSLLTLFFTQFVLSHAPDNTTSPNIGGRIHGPSPSQIFGGPSPQYPYKSPPMNRGD